MKPFRYQNKRKSQYFEGWYCRIYSGQHHINYAVIFAISKAKNDPHAFIQLINGTTNKMTYYRYETKEFQYNNGVVSIGPNELQLDYIRLDLDTIRIEGKMKSLIFIDSFFGWKSAMGFLSIFPLQCFQEVLYLNSQFEGSITVKEHKRLIQGSSYMEKTYGHQFPTKWIWLQCNQFSVSDLFLSASIGMIPFGKRSILGYIVFVRMQDKELRFATYNRSSIRIVSENDTKEVHLKRGKYKVIIGLIEHNPMKLVGPSASGTMDLDVFESITSTISVKVFKKDKCIIDAIGDNVGAEWMYEMDKDNS